MSLVSNKQAPRGLIGMSLIDVMTQQELERLLKDSKEIAEDWDTYVQFRRNRDAVMRQVFPKETLN